MITEDQLEQLCLNWFQTIGYETVCGYDIAPGEADAERDNYRQVLLHARLLAQLEVINPQVPLATLEQVAQQIAKADTPILTKNNRAFYKWLLEGVKVEYKDEKGVEKIDYVRLIDFNQLANNQFLVVNQFTITGSKGNRRPDLLVFINGIPLAVIELKNPKDEQADIWSAYQQLQTYKEELSDLFIFNQTLIISDGIKARLGSLTANKERFQPWRVIKNEKDRPKDKLELETLVRGFFEPAYLLDFVQNFILFEEGELGDLIKKIAGYHQFHAVRAAVQSTLLASKTLAETSTSLNKVAEKPALYSVPDTNSNKSKAARIYQGELAQIELASGKAGVVWHTQGSGKSISMLCYAAKLLAQPEMNNPTIVVVTDRNDLDGQLFNTFVTAADTLKQTPIQVDDREALREVLGSRKAGGIFFTTIQKFGLMKIDGVEETQFPTLSNRGNIVVISDEAHRSHYGEKAKLKTKKDNDGKVISAKYTHGYSKYLRDALPNAAFIGFTGTPIEQGDKITTSVFGPKISTYDIQDAVDDGSTVPIFYESRLARLNIKTEKLYTLDDEVDEVIEDEEDSGKREQTKSKWAALEKLVGADKRIKLVCQDLVDHFELRNSTLDGKAMLVSMSRDICAAMYEAIIALRPDWHNDDPEKGTIKIVMTGSASDKQALQPHIHDKKTKKLFERRFKDVNDPLKIVIVRDMWLTGFDAPNCHTMYLDKPMKGHNLMQAIARVNRVFKDKPGGLVVDYIGIGNELKEALKVYTNADGKGKTTLNSEEALAVFMENMDKLHSLMHGCDYSGFEQDPLLLFPKVMNRIAAIESPVKNDKGKGKLDGKSRFLDIMANIRAAYTLCATLDEAKPYSKEIAFFDAIKAAICKSTNVDKKRNDEAKHSALKQILDNAIETESVDNIFELVGLEKPNIGLLSEGFLEDLANIEHKNLAVDLLEKLLRDEVKARMSTDVVSEKSYTDRITETMRKYHNRGIESAHVIEEMIQMAKDMANDAELAKKMNLNSDEVAFYRALIQNESAVKELGNNNLRELAKYVTGQLRKSTKVDWQVRDSVRAKLRNLVRRALRKWKYPPDKADEAIELCLKQAEALSNSWSV